MDGLGPDVMGALALALGAAWASGINLYLAALMIGGLGMTGAVDLPPDLEVLASPPVIATAALLYGLEFFADKIPGIDSLNDALHTFIRIPAGALLAMGSVSGVAEPWQAAAALVLGGVVSAGSHAAKTGSRALINTSPEPFSNWFASIFEDVIVIVGLLLALFKPVVFLIWMALFALLLIWLLPKLLRGLRAIWQRIQGFRAPGKEPGSGLAASFKGPPDTPSSGAQPPQPRP
ncbi:DUF4126 domain-containing protein [Thalassospiraceae bacterium LMO-JJ14]|nr:DUF4126 domain-containing protein [Thalassospiraceae bacterium LMO-JJ14]